MLERFPPAPAAAPVLISRGELGLEKLSSGRQAGGRPASGGETEAKRTQATKQSSRPKQKKTKKRRRVLTQDAEVRLQPTEPGTESSWDGANSSLEEEIKIERGFSPGSSEPWGSAFPNPAAAAQGLRAEVGLQVMQDSQGNTKKGLCHGATRQLALPSGCTGLSGARDRLSEKIPAAQKLFQYASSRLGSFLRLCNRGRECSAAASRSQGLTSGALVSLHS